jgi:CheY-like chemotaxis protein
MTEQWVVDVTLTPEELAIIRNALTGQVVHYRTMVEQYKHYDAPGAPATIEKFSRLGVEARRIQMQLEELANDPQSAALGWRRAPSPEAHVALPLNTTSILVIEDDPGVQEWLVELLEEEGYTVRSARDGLDGMVAIEKESPDLILLDLAMPIMDGGAFLDELARHHIAVPIIVLTAFPERHRPGAAIAEFLQKPIVNEELLAAIARHLE